MNPKDKIGRTKPCMSFVPTPPLLELAEVMKLGSEEYGFYNWREDPVSTRCYLDAALRHLFAIMRGEDIDESGFHHHAHVMANMIILMDAKQQGTLIEDRPASKDTTL